KYITQATAHAPDLRKHIYKGIRSLNKQTVLAWLQEALERADEPSRQKRIQETIKYIDNNWDGIGLPYLLGNDMIELSEYYSVFRLFSKKVRL
ncbi:MAG: hypothetical protein GX167_00665, partial [Firmicutes bacterium]|nr:hypothetical protein [Bacillota bacterium]